MWTRYFLSNLYYKQAYCIFGFYLFLLNMVNHYANKVKSSSNLDTVFIHLKPFTCTFWDIPHPYKLFASKFMRNNDSMSLFQFFMYLLFAFAHLYNAWHILPLIPFHPLITYQYLLIIRMLLLPFLNKLAMLIQAQTKERVGSSSYSRYSFDTFNSKVLNTSANNDVSFQTYRSWYSRIFIFSSSNTFWASI